MHQSMRTPVSSGRERGGDRGQSRHLRSRASMLPTPAAWDPLALSCSSAEPTAAAHAYPGGP